MHRILALLSLLLILGCADDDDDFGSPRDDDDNGEADDDDGDDDDDDGDDDDDDSPLGPAGFLRGTVVDATTGAAQPGVTVTELDSDPPNARPVQDDGFFLIEPNSWDPAQLWAGADDYIETGLVIVEDAYLEAGYPVEMLMWPREDGIEWVLETFGYEWSAKTGVVIVDLHTPLPGDVEGIAATLDAPSIGPFYFDGDGGGILGGSIPGDTDRPWIAWVGVGHGSATLEVEAHPELDCLYPSEFDALGDAIVFVRVVCL